MIPADKNNFRGQSIIFLCKRFFKRSPCGEVVRGSLDFADIIPTAVEICQFLTSLNETKIIWNEETTSGRFSLKLISRLWHFGHGKAWLCLPIVTLQGEVIKVRKLNKLSMRCGKKMKKSSKPQNIGNSVRWMWC